VEIADKVERTFGVIRQRIDTLLAALGLRGPMGDTAKQLS
jgi:hypothetical protein